MVIRNLSDEPMAPVSMPGVEGASMAVMVGREDGAPNFALRSFFVKPGGHTPRHAHDYEHEVYVVAGEGTVLLGGCERRIRAGDVIFVPPNHEHQFRAAVPDDPDLLDQEDYGLRFLCVVPVARNCGEPIPGT